MKQVQSRGESFPPNRAVILTLMICIIFVGSGYALHDLSGWYRLPTRNSFEFFPIKIGKWTRIRSYHSKKIIDFLQADDGVLATYQSKSIDNPVHLFIAFYDYQSIYRTTHTPQSCDFYAGWNVIGTRKKTFCAGHAKNVTAMIHTLEKGKTGVLAGSFFYQRGRTITSPWMNKFYLFWDAVTKRRTDGTIVRAEVVLLPGQSFEEAYPALEDFLIELREVLQNYAPA